MRREALPIHRAYHGGMKFLAAIDLSTSGHEWLADQALAFATAYGGTVDLLFIGTDAGANDKLRALLERGPEAVRGQTLVQAGDPLTRIISAAENYDALVMGPRAHGALERFVRNESRRVEHRLAAE